MHPESHQEKLQRGEPAYGHGICFFAGPEHARFAANAGFDFLLIDSEVTPSICRRGLRSAVPPWMPA